MLGVSGLLVNRFIVFKRKEFSIIIHYWLICRVFWGVVTTFQALTLDNVVIHRTEGYSRVTDELNADLLKP